MVKTWIGGSWQSCFGGDDDGGDGDGGDDDGGDDDGGADDDKDTGGMKGR